MANRLQKCLLSVYPDLDLLNFEDPTDEIEIEDVVDHDGSGDRLFDFLWSELADSSNDNDALTRLQKARDGLSDIMIRLGMG